MRENRVGGLVIGFIFTFIVCRFNSIFVAGIFVRHSRKAFGFVVVGCRFNFTLRLLVIGGRPNLTLLFTGGAISWEQKVCWLGFELCGDGESRGGSVFYCRAWIGQNEPWAMAGAGYKLAFS